MAAPENQNPMPQPQADVKPDPQTPPAPKKKSKGTTFLLIVSILIWIAAVGAVAYLYLQNRQLTQQLSEEIAMQEETPTPAPTATPEPENTLISVDDTWNLYTNYDLGFSMNVPKSMYHGYGECEFKQDENSYRPKLASVPLGIFELPNKAVITSEYFYELGDERVEGGINYYSSCDKVINTALAFQDDDNFHQQGWEIIGANVSGDDELETFVKENYGSGCKVGEKTENEQVGVYDVKIDVGSYENFEDAEAAGCLVNYLYELKYAPEKERVITWTVGQAYSFYKNASYEPYDEDMITSFKMLD